MSYPGGKNGKGVYQTIINLMPPHEVYIEPFLGSGAILLRKKPARVNIGLDLDAVAVGEVEAAVTRMDDGKRSRTIAHTSGNDVARSSVEMVRKSRDITTEDDVVGSLTSGSDDVAGKTITSNGEPRPLDPPIISAGGRLPSFDLMQGDGLAYLESYKFTGVELVYCDPPYLMGTRDGVQRYTHEMSDVHHRHLLRCCRKIQAKVMISGYWSSLYAKQLAGWHSIHFETMTRGGLATEWLWFNYPPPVELHDYRYLGANYRERERIKMKKARWVARLNRMPVLERQALLGALAEVGQAISS